MEAKDTSGGRSSAPSDAIDAAAAEWVIRLGGLPLTPREREALDVWLDADLQHRKSFDLARRAWDPAIRDDERPRFTEAARPTPESIREHGHLLFDRAPLRDAVAQLNRYRRVPLMIIGASLRKRRISGAFRLAELDNASEWICRKLRVRVLSVPGLVTLIY